MARPGRRAMRPEPRPLAPRRSRRAWRAASWLVLAGLCCRQVEAKLDPPPPAVEGVEPRVRERLLERFSAVQKSPVDGEVWGRYGMALEAHRQVDAAQIAYEEARRLSPKDFRWPYYLGTLLEYRDPDEAARWLLIAVELDGGYAPARIRLGEVLEKLGRSEEAAKQFQHAERLDPTNPLAPFGSGRIALAAGEVGEAVGHLERAYRLGRDVQAIVVTLSRAVYRQGDAERARSLAAEARGLPRMTHHEDPRRAAVRDEAVDTESYLLRARTYLDVGQAQRALAVVSELLRSDPEQAEAHLLAAGIHDALGDTAAATREAEAALALDPELLRARGVLAGALFKSRRPAEAEREARRVLSEDPNDFHMLLIVALCAGERGDAPVMLAHLDRAFAARNADPQLRRLLRQLLMDVADSFAAVGQRREAAARLDQALVLSREDGEAAGVLDELGRRIANLR
jgi:tetratricopeptide (TPR) repeat protein